MQKYLWSTVILMLVTSVATYLAATCKNCPNCQVAKSSTALFKGSSVERTGPIQSLVLIPTQPPAFMIEPIEPITVEPEPRLDQVQTDKYLERALALRVAGEPLAPVPCRMPYADEALPCVDFWKMVVDLMGQVLPEDQAEALSKINWIECSQGRDYDFPFAAADRNVDVAPGTSSGRLEVESRPQADAAAAIDVALDWLTIVDELIQQILPLPGTEVEPIDPGIEAPMELVPPAQEPAAPTMPVPDYHHYHDNSCPYLHGCPRGYSSFPPPAYRFERQTPSSPPANAAPVSETTPK
jgi:hypothetical protein